MALFVTRDIPEKFYIVYDSINYPLSLLISITEKSEHEYKIHLVVPLPDGYPDTLFKENSSIVATLIMYYHVRDKNMYIDLFFVYNKMTGFKDKMTENEVFHTKDLGQYMLCTAVQFLLRNTSWFDMDSIVTLKAYGGECFRQYQDFYKVYPFESCIEELERKVLLFDFFINYLEYNDKLLTRLEKDSDLTLYYEGHKEEVNTLIKKMLNELNEKEHKTQKILRMLQRYLCEVRTNDDLINNYYKKVYGFDVVENHGLYSSMAGDVHSLLKACVSGRDLAMYKALHHVRKKISEKVNVSDDMNEDWIQGRTRKKRYSRRCKR
jgi:hypothetical protein